MTSYNALKSSLRDLINKRENVLRMLVKCHYVEITFYFFGSMWHTYETENYAITLKYSLLRHYAPNQHASEFMIFSETQAYADSHFGQLLLAIKS